MAKVRKRLTKYQVDISPVDASYGDQITMIGDQANQQAGFIYYDGDVYYEYLGTTDGDIDDYRVLGSGGVDWDTITADQTAIKNKGYITDKTGSRLILTLPSSGNEYSVRVAGLGVSGWRIIVPPGGSISWIDEENIVQLDSTQVYDSIELVCVNPGQFVVISSIGNIEFTK